MIETNVVDRGFVWGGGAEAPKEAQFVEGFAAVVVSVDVFSSGAYGGYPLAKF